MSSLFTIDTLRLIVWLTCNPCRSNETVDEALGALCHISDVHIPVLRKSSQRVLQQVSASEGVKKNKRNPLVN